MTNKKHYSLRLLVLALVGSSLALFTIVLFAVFYTAMPKILLQSETRYLVKQMEVVEGLFDAAMYNTFVMADDIGIWDETVYYVQGENPGYFNKNWPDVSFLRSYSFNFVVIRDLDGTVLYKEFLDYVNNEELPEPEGFVRYLDTISNQVLDMYKLPHDPDGDVRDLGKGGIIFYDNTPYFIAAMPVMFSRGAGSPSGTIILGSTLSNEYFRALTHYESLDFELLPPDASVTPEAGINRESSDIVSSTLLRRDIDGNPVLLRMSGTRPIYMEGRDIIDKASLILVAAMLLFGVGLYQTGVRLLIRPMERLSRDIAQIGVSGTVDISKYDRSRELVTLGSAINDMLERLDQSRISISVLQRILNGLDVYLYVTDLEGDTILFANQKFMDQYGLCDSTLAGKTCHGILHNSPVRCGFCPKNKLDIKPNEVIVWEDHDAATGQYLRNTDCLIEWTDKRLVHLHHAMDITNIKVAEEALKKRLDQQELMSAMSQTFISTVDTDKLINNALDMVGRFMGLDKILAARVTDSGDHLEAFYQWFTTERECYRPEETSLPFGPGTVEYDTFITNQEAYAAYDDISKVEALAIAHSHGVKSLVGIPIHVNNEFWGMLSFNECSRYRQWSESDIQLCKMVSTVISAAMTRQALEGELIRMSSIVESSPQFISYITPAGRFEYFNPGTLVLLGYTAEDLRRGGIDILFGPETIQKVRQEIIPMILETGKHEFELPVLCKNGQTRVMSFSAFKTDFDSVGIGTIAMDITEKRRLESELIVAKEQAEQSNIATSEFLSRMSHEMRTPLNAIIGMTSIAKSAPDIEKKEYCLDKIDDASVHLLGVINDILDMSKIEAQKFELSYTEFNFEKMLLRVINVVNFRVDEKNQNLIVHLDPNVPLSVICDDQRLAQVVANLLSNAVKFTPERGTITVSVSKLDETNGVCTLQVEVADNGIGISQEQVGRLFRSFEQADGGIARKFGGTGLGLAISKSIVEMMGGSIWVESEEGKGSKFIFTIKAQKGSADKQPLLSPEVNWKNMRVLVVDDAPDVREYFLNFAKSIGLECEVAADGVAACEIIEQSQDRPFNIVFADWKMPGMDGIELTRRIKDNFGAKVVVIMISATQWSDISDEAQAAGVDRFLPKPLFSSLIVDCVNQCLGLERADNSEDDDPREVLQEDDIFVGRQVLLAEDIEINREIVISLLQHTGVNIDSAENGREAVEMFKAHPDRYDMIFMDIHMPEVDGYEATRTIRALEIPRAKTIPIVAMTANVFREDIERCLASGMDDHVGKPVDMVEIMATMRRFLSKRAVKLSNS